MLLFSLASFLFKGIYHILKLLNFPALKSMDSGGQHGKNKIPKSSRDGALSVMHGMAITLQYGSMPVCTERKASF